MPEGVEKTHRDDGQVTVVAAIVLGGFLAVLAIGSMAIAQAYAQRAAFQAVVDAAVVRAAMTAEPIVTLDVRVHEVVWNRVEDPSRCTSWADENGQEVCVVHPFQWVKSDEPSTFVTVSGAVPSLFGGGEVPGWAQAAGCEAVGVDPEGPPYETVRVCDAWRRVGPVRWRYPDPRATEAAFLSVLRARYAEAELRALRLAPCGDGDACTGRLEAEAATPGVSLFGRPATLVVRAASAPTDLRMPESGP